MSDAKNNDPKRPAIEPLDDELVIDLIDEVPGGPEDGDLSDLEKNLLSLGQSFGRGFEKTGAALRPSPELPDLNDLAGFAFEEEDTERPAPGTLPPAAAKAPLPTGMEPELDWLLDEDPPAPVENPARAAGGTDNDITEILEFDEQFLDAAEGIGDPPATEDESADENVDETLELLDIDDNDTDNELVWFDDLDQPPAYGGAAQAGQVGVAHLEPAGTRLFPDAPAADTAATDLFDAFVQLGRPIGGGTLITAGLPSAAAAPLTPIPDTTALSQPRTTNVSPLPAANALTEDQIDAAVERVITRMYAGTIETIILQSIEKAVFMEIDRLKNRLLENDPGDKIP